MKKAYCFNSSMITPERNGTKNWKKTVKVTLDWKCCNTTSNRYRADPNIYCALNMAFQLLYLCENDHAKNSVKGSIQWQNTAMTTGSLLTPEGQTKYKISFPAQLWMCYYKTSSLASPPASSHNKVSSCWYEQGMSVLSCAIAKPIIAYTHDISQYKTEKLPGYTGFYTIQDEDISK